MRLVSGCAISALLLVASGCVETGREFQYDAVSKISKGMEVSEVIGLMGVQPNSRAVQASARGPVECLGWSHTVAIISQAEAKMATVCFLNGKAISASQGQTNSN